jgi:hypothetical protein
MEGNMKRVKKGILYISIIMLMFSMIITEPVPDRLYKEESYKLLLTVSYGSQKKDTVQRQFTLNMTKKEAKQAQKIRQISEDMEKTYLISDRSAILFFAACFMLFISVFLIYYRQYNCISCGKGQE